MSKAGNEKSGKSSADEKDLDCTNCGRGVWLVKVPKYIQQTWSSVSPNAEVGRLKIVRNGTKQPLVTLSCTETNGSQSTKLPKEHKFLIRSKGAILGIFSQNQSNESTEPEKVFMEGHVIQKFECQPIFDENYMNLKKEAVLKASTPHRQAKVMSHPANIYKPKSFHSHIKAQEERKKAEGKKSRDDRDKVQELLFSAFEKHQYYNIKDLQKITRQPITYLKEILKELCDYNVKNPHKNMWELKKEYRHYKEKSDSPKAKAMDTD